MINRDKHIWVELPNDNKTTSIVDIYMIYSNDDVIEERIIEKYHG